MCGERIKEAGNEREGESGRKGENEYKALPRRTTNSLAI